MCAMERGSCGCDEFAAKGSRSASANAMAKTSRGWWS
jgi:hypothetical protein